VWFDTVTDAITKELRSQGVIVPQIFAVAQSHPVQALQFLFPNHFIQAACTGMTSYRIRPLGPDSCLFEIWSLQHPNVGNERQAPMEPAVLPHDLKEFPELLQQDWANVPGEQRGIHAPGFEFMPRCRTSAGLIAENHRILDAMIAKTPLESIARATALLTQNIKDSVLGHAKI
jgi:hypothetical protein